MDKKKTKLSDTEKKSESLAQNPNDLWLKAIFPKSARRASQRVQINWPDEIRLIWRRKTLLKKPV
tara:strand:- start:1522 stop:1716 length:195 start_codon:yes stop_codon:yes gene_type:complete